jgi:small GTP-binding protein
VNVPTVLENYNATILVGDEELRISLRDTAGQEAYTKIRISSYPKTNIFFYCYSVVNPASYTNVAERWDVEVERHAPSKSFLKMVVGMKTDLRSDEETLESLKKEGREPLTVEDGVRMAQRVGAIGYVECSALTSLGLKEVIDTALMAVLDLHHAESDPTYARNYRLPNQECIVQVKSARNANVNENENE